MEDNHNLLAPASPELGTAQPQLVLSIFSLSMYVIFINHHLAKEFLTQQNQDLDMMAFMVQCPHIDVPIVGLK